MSLLQLRTAYPAERLELQGHALELVRSHGPGQPLLLLPGAQGTGEVFYKQILAWGGERDMTAVTYPALTDPQVLADIVAGVADALGHASFDLIGSSYGGYLAQWVAARHPGRVGRLVVGNSFADPRPAQSAEKLAALEAKTPRDLKAEAMTRLLDAPQSEFKDVMLDLVGLRQPDAMLRARMLAVQKAAPVPLLGIAEASMLLVESDNDPLISPAMREAIRRHYPGAGHCVIASGGHYPYMLKAEEYNACVGAFLGLA